MKRKNLFLFSVLVLFSYLTFFYVSCFSGLTNETGEVSFTFTEPMLSKIISRDVGSDIPDLISEYDALTFAPQNVKYQFTGYSSGVDELTQMPNSFILYLYEGGAYELYSLNLIRSIYADYEKELSQIFSGQVSNFSELFKNALISKGEWVAADNYIDITEQQYRSSAATSGDLLNVSSTVSIRFLLSKSVLDFDSHGGYHITFYNINSNYSDFPYEDEEDYGEGDYIPKIRVELTSGGKTYTKEAEIVQVEYAALGHAWFESPDMPDGQKKTYLLIAYSDGSYKIQELEDGRLLSIVSEGKWKQDFTEDGSPALYIYEDGKSAEQIIPFEGDDGFEVMLNDNPVWFNGNDAEEELADFKYLPVSVSFKNLPRGARAKVYAEIFVKSPHGKTMTIATGESTDFIIESNTVVNVKMKIKYDPDYPDDDIDKPNDKKTVYFAQAMIPDAYLDVFNGGWLYFNAYDDNTYDIFGNIYDENIQPVEKRTFAKGIWESDEERSDFLHLYETEYYDFNQDKLVSEEEGGIDIDLSKKNFKYNGWSAVELHFKMSGYVEEEDPDTMLALYNFDYFGENNYSLYFVDKADASLDSSSEYNFGYKSNYGSSDMSFSYDKEGNVFALSCYYDSNLYRKIVTNNHSYEIPSSVLGTADNLNSITIDRKKDNLYIYGYSGYQGEEPYFIYSWPKASLSNMAASTKKYSLLTDSLDFTDDQLQSMFHSIKSFAVYNDQLYLPVITASTLNVIKLDLSETVYDADSNSYKLILTDDNIASYEVLSEPLIGFPKISDVLWQDDYIYVLLRDVSINDSWYDDSSFRSRGALVRINLSTDEYNVLGWTNEAVDVSSAGIYFKKDSNWDSFYYEDAEHTKLFVMDGTQQMETGSSNLISSYYPPLYIPDGGENLSEAAFYGPEKFIAIKPKKLVIADDGFAFYTNADGALTYRNVNRVVEVDLEDFAITDSTEVSVKFAGDASSSFSGDYTRDITKNYYIADSGNFYYGSAEFNGSVYDKNGEVVSNFGGDKYLAIKCADNE